MALARNRMGTAETCEDNVFSQKSLDGETHPGMEYIKGTVLKIRLKNFLAYEELQLFPGPNLNLIMGPNGAGKSSLVCALALGLGGKPDLLARQKTSQGFIKDGCEVAEIELRLKGDPGTPIIQILRTIKRGNNAGSWTVNDRACTEKDVKKLVSSLNIQIDNLCSFMPQERVIEFAQLSPQDILKEAERSLGESKQLPLYEWHKSLCELRGSQTQALVSIEEYTKRLNQQRTRLVEVEREIYKLDERADLLDQIKKLEMKIEWIRYEDSRNKYIILKEERQKQKNNLSKFKAELTSTLERLKQSENKLHEINNSVGGYRSEINEILNGSNGIAKYVSQIQNKEGTLKSLYMNLNSISRKMVERNESIKCLKENIQKATNRCFELEKELGLPNVIDKSVLDKNIKSLEEVQRKVDANNLDLSSLTQKLRDTREKQRELEIEASDLVKKKNEINDELDAFDDIRRQRLEMIRRSDNQCYEATLWIHQNSHLFQKKVFDPIILEISPRDQRFAEAIESSLNRSSLMTFVTQCRTDWFTLNEELIIKRKYRISIVDVSDFKPEMFGPPVPRGRLESMGFAGYVIDFIDCPKEIGRALCMLCNLHLQPVSQVELTLEQQRSAEAGYFTNFFSGNTYYTVRKAYESVSITAQPVKPLRWLAKNVNSELKKSLEERVDQIRAKIDKCAREMKRIISAESNLNNQIEELKSSRESLLSKRKDIMTSKQKLNQYICDIDTYKVHMECLGTFNTDINAEESKIKAEIFEVAKSRYELSKEVLKLHESAVEKNTKIIEWKLLYLTCCNNIVDLNNKVNDIKELIVNAEAKYNTALEQYAESKAEAKSCLESFKDKLEKLTAAEKSVIEKFQADKTYSQLENMLIESKARVEALNNVNGSSREKYENIKKEMAKCEYTISELNKEVTESDEKIAIIKAKWYPALMGLVSRVHEEFSLSLERMGCAGEVRVVGCDDFSKWKLEILVKFRDEEKLGLLTAQRQSGGERSLATIIFIIALRKLSISPLCVVDEINQGMDTRNERIAHNELVRVSCNSSIGQTFIISPKLIPGLEYHPAMRILCVYKIPKLLGTVDIDDLIKKMSSSQITGRTKRVKATA